MPKRPRSDTTTTDTIDLTQFDNTTLSYNDILPKHSIDNANHTQNNNNTEILFVAVHGGAGKHATSKHTALKQLMSDACNIALQCNNSIDAVTNALKYMEQSELVNAGRGSVLDKDKQQSMDACICYYNDSDRTNEWCGVGNVSNVKSPIEIAACMLRDRLDVTDLSCNRVKPILLCGNDVEQYAEHMLGSDAIVQPTISDRLKSKWLKYANMLKSQITTSQPIEARSENTADIPQHSTIGCIVVDSAYNICCGSSSGGIWLKVPGRVGNSAIATASAYAQPIDNVPMNDIFGENFACTQGVCYSGVGEELLRCNAAQQLCHKWNDVNVSKKKLKDKIGDYGRITVRVIHVEDPTSPRGDEVHEIQIEFYWQFTTPELAVAHQCSEQMKNFRDCLRGDSIIADKDSDELCFVLRKVVD